MPYAADFVGLLLRQAGDRYVFGHEVSADDADPEVFDCSELVQWGCARLGVSPVMPDGSWLQATHCRNRGTSVDVATAIRTQGALLFRFSSDPYNGSRPSSAHVAVSLGNGSTIEARGSAWGVGSWTTDRRGWTHGALVPGVDYGPPSPAPHPDGSSNGVPPWPGRYLTQPPVMTGDDVRIWQAQMNKRGARLDVDGAYGPASAAACRTFQQESGLEVDGIVGPSTWAATFA